MTKPIDPKLKGEFEAQDPATSEWHSGPVLELNFNELLEEARDMDLTEDQARELIQTYWNIAMHFVQMGFGLHPVQLVTEEHKAQENAGINQDFLASDTQNMVQLQYDADNETSEELEPEGGAP